MDWKKWLALVLGIGGGIALFATSMVFKSSDATTNEEPTIQSFPKASPAKIKCGVNETFERCLWWRFTECKYDEARKICRERKSELVVVETHMMYHKLMDSLRRELGGKHAQLWTGMTFDPTDGSVTSPDPCYVEWASNNPTSDKQRMNIAVSVRNDARYTGMSNEDPRQVFDGVVCQRTATNKPK